MTTAILRSQALRDVEARFAAVQPPLMERAGAALAAEIERMAPPGLPVLIVAGPGNNGGDGFVAARLLSRRGIKPTVVFVGDASRLPADARAAHDAWRATGGTEIADIPGGNWGLAVDALFGIGLARPVEGRVAELIGRINTLGSPILAVDIPSGLCAETGRVLGACIGASRTLTFIAGKPGLFTLDGPDHCGEITVDDLGLDIGKPDGSLIGKEHFGEYLQSRRRNTHKGDFGSVGIVGGAPGMAGAALLAGRAALKTGAGRVYVGMLEKLAVDPAQPELMLRPADEVFGLASVLAAGPGLGQSNEALDALRRAVESPLPLVLDADALNLLAAHPVLAAKVRRRNTPTGVPVASPTVLTPHPAEAGRLLGTTTEAVQSDRLAAALELAQRFHAHVVLKGCGSIVAAPDRRWFINATGNAGLASAGSGDVLTGIVAALLSQHWPALEASLAAVHLHGCAADDLAAGGIGPIGIAAGELIEAARAQLNHWVANG